MQGLSLASIDATLKVGEARASDIGDGFEKLREHFWRVFGEDTEFAGGPWSAIEVQLLQAHHFERFDWSSDPIPLGGFGDRLLRKSRILRSTPFKCRSSLRFLAHGVASRFSASVPRDRGEARHNHTAGAPSRSNR